MQDRQLAAVDVHAFHLYLAWYPTTRLADEEEGLCLESTGKKSKSWSFRSCCLPPTRILTKLSYWMALSARSVQGSVGVSILWLLQEVRGIPDVWEQVRQWSAQVAYKPMLITDLGSASSRNPLTTAIACPVRSPTLLPWPGSWRWWPVWLSWTSGTKMDWRIPGSAPQDASGSSSLQSGHLRRAVFLVLLVWGSCSRP